MIDVEARNAIIAMVMHLVSAFKMPARPRTPQASHLSFHPLSASHQTQGSRPAKNAWLLPLYLLLICMLVSQECMTA